jgi:hypothetical protein
MKEKDAVLWIKSDYGKTLTVATKATESKDQATGVIIFLACVEFFSNSALVLPKAFWRHPIVNC